MRKKIGTILGLLLEAALFAGAYIVKYFTAKKMGMARHVIYMNQTWEKAYPLEQWKLISILVLAVLLVLAVALLIRRRRQLSPSVWAEALLMMGLTLFSLHFTLTNSVSVLRPYYWMSPMFAAAALLQILRTIPLLFRKT